jgi:serine phosphatase RsbU (regulator of sigma subunit)/DNA-binding NarL/FixJ family response regulator
MKTEKEINIFIVDDNKTFALTLQSAIENAFDTKNIKVLPFETGENCMAKFNEILPELVILDYILNSKSPDAADGHAVLEKIKARSPETSVIMLTSNNSLDIALESFRQGASDYVVKTDFEFREIKKSITRIFANQERLLNYENNAKVAFWKNLAIQKPECIIAEIITPEKDEAFTRNKHHLKNSDWRDRTSGLRAVKAQLAEVERSKLIAEEQNNNRADSLNCAGRIQETKLPRKEDIFAALPDSFVLFKPKDIVSGNFYFFHKASPVLSPEGHLVFLAAADCTGDGETGAFLSMIGSAKLSDAVSQSSDPSEILMQLNNTIKTSLLQSDNFVSSRDGIDIALCTVDTEKLLIRYAGANRPIWIVRKGTTVVEEIKATENAIGGFTANNQCFDTHEIQLQKGDTFYLFSDGHADSLGGKFGKEVMTRKFKEFVVSIQNCPMAEQRERLDAFLGSWKINDEQSDDILVIGVRM